MRVRLQLVHADYSRAGKQCGMWNRFRMMSAAMDGKGYDLFLVYKLVERWQ
jgi:hypothetical protein